MASNERGNVHFIREVAVRYVGRSTRVEPAIRRPTEAVDFMRRVVRDDWEDRAVEAAAEGPLAAAALAHLADEALSSLS